MHIGAHINRVMPEAVLGNRLLVALILLMAWPVSSCVEGDRKSGGKGRTDFEILLTPVDESGLRAALQKSKGQVIVLNFWATWCEPCREEFPDLLRLQARYRQKGLHLMLLSMDEVDQNREIKHFLRGKGVDFESYIRSKSDFGSFVNSVDPNWIGAIPATFVFDRSGSRVNSFIGPQKFETLEGAVRPLL